MHEWFVFDDFDKASKVAADYIAEKIELAIKERDNCHVALPGGNTPKTCLKYLADKKISWSKVHWYLGDERCYPSGHADRNDVMLDNNLWSRLPDANIHRILSELGAENAARLYAKEIINIKCFDIVFLGIGEDGHTASLFPDNDALKDERAVVPVFNSPKAPSDRVSLSVKTLQQAKCRVVLCSGSGKAEITSQIKNGDVLPINQIGDVNWFVDKEAVS